MNGPPPLRPPPSSHHTPWHRPAAYQAAPPRRNATPTTLLPGRVLGFPPAYGGERVMGSADALQEGMMAPSGVTASESEEPAKISPTSPSTATHSNRGHPTIKPPASTRHHGLGHIQAAPLRTPPRGQGGRKEAPSDGRNHTEAKREGTTSPADVREARAPGDVMVTDRTWQQGTPGPPWPGQVHNGPAKPRRPCCSKPAPAPPAPSRQRCSPASWRPRCRPVPSPARPDPDGARRA